MVVTFKDPCNKDLFVLVGVLMIRELEKTYHTEREHSSQTEDDSISPANAKGRSYRHLTLFAKTSCKKLGVERDDSRSCRM
jgi:hypothetical protein